MIEVHHFKVLNSRTGEWETSRAKRTAEDIATLKGEIIADTGQMVFRVLLDTEGRYFPPNPGEDDT